MGEKLTLLHLSDLHLGSPRGKSLWGEREAELLRALEKQRKEFGAPDLVLLTGDLVWNGTAENFQLLDGFLTRLKKSISSEAMLVPVPGNHDVTWRGESDPWIQTLLAMARGEANRQTEALGKGESKTCSELAEPFAAYAAWLEKSIYPTWRQVSAAIDPGLLPGDFLLRVAVRDWQLGVVGVNSAWASTFDERLTERREKFREVVGACFEQVTSIPSFVEKLHTNHVNLILAHHPLSWWAPDRKDDFLSHIFNPRLISAMMSGHLHQARARCETGESGLPRRTYESGAIYGAEVHRASPKAPLEYSWLTIERLGDNTARLEEHRHIGSFGPDHVFSIEPTRGLPAEDITLLTPPQESPRKIAIVGIAKEFKSVFDAIKSRCGVVSSIGQFQFCDAKDAAVIHSALGTDLSILLFGSLIDDHDTLKIVAEKARECVPFKIDKPSTDDLTDEQATRHRALRKFLKDATLFTTLEALPALVYDALVDWSERQSPKPAAERAGLHAYERDYLNANFDLWAGGVYNPFLRIGDGKHLQHADVYEPLRLTPTDEVFEDKDGKIAVREHPASENVGRNRSQILQVDEKGGRFAPRAGSVLSTKCIPHAIVRGHPGSGKSVLLQHMAQVLASEHLGKPQRAHELQLQDLREGAPLLPIPILIQAEQLAVAIESSNAVKAPSLELLAKAVYGAIAGNTSGELLKLETVKESLRRGRYILLIDALDEVKDMNMRQPLLNLLSVVKAASKSRIILSTRPTAHTGALSFPSDFRVFELAELDKVTIDSLAQRYGEARGFDSAWSQSCIAAIQEGEERLDASILTRNPLQLTAGLMIYTDTGKLPESPEELYRKIVSHLCERRPSPTWSADRRRQFLQKLFFEAQKFGGRETPISALTNVVEPEGAKGRTEVEKLLDIVGEATGLLRFEHRRATGGNEDGSVLVPFHKSYQEFLAAEWLAARDNDEILKILQSPLERSGLPPLFDLNWTHCLRFLIGCLNQRDRKFSIRLANAIRLCLKSLPYDLLSAELLQGFPRPPFGVNC